MRPLITLTTDFGTNDGYLAAMKGTILSIAPNARLIDITHSITAFDVMEAAFVLRQAAPYFPANTIHLVVVDPGVGSHRRPVALRYKSHYLVGPDNGLFSLLVGDDMPVDLVELDQSDTNRLGRPSATFHGRDIFAPAAALLAAGRTLDSLGSRIHSLRPLRWAVPIDDDQGIHGLVVQIDGFGNCITNISQSLFEQRCAARNLKCYVGNAIIKGLTRTYSEGEIGEPILLFGSDNNLEVAVNRGDAAGLFHIHRGTPIDIMFAGDR